MNALTGFRSLPDHAMARRDLTRVEADALKAHRALLAKARAVAAEFRAMHSGAHDLSSSQLTEAAELADAIGDYVAVLESECERINAGECEG